ncbi:uncharacterized protein LOC134230609 [Saccostrea cucullata]|uniref:uncharacterized protein LOC134230609 n=1 Tax=Saccostrea cuccullata TaxID=36930 RepID=UPI002ED36B73
MIILKDSLKEILAVDEESLNSLNSVTEFLNLLKHKKVFTDRDVIAMQYLMRLIKRPDLEQKCIDFATSRKERLCYFQEEKHADGCSRVRLHVVDDIENFIKLESLVETVAAIVECDPKSIQVVGVIRESSFIILIEVEKKTCRNTLKEKRRDAQISGV